MEGAKHAWAILAMLVKRQRQAWPCERAMPLISHEMQFELTPAFASNLENLMDDNCSPLWIHGICMSPMTTRPTASEWFATHAAMRQMP